MFCRMRRAAITSVMPPATYTVQINIIGYTSEPRTGVQLTREQSVSFDFALQKAMVRWSDLNTYQGLQLLPKTKNHDLSKAYQDPFFTGCMISCHSFQKRMASTTRNQEGWRAAVKYMRDVIMGGEGGGGMSDERVEDFAAYLTAAFGPDSPKPKSPEE